MLYLPRTPALILSLISPHTDIEPLEPHPDSPRVITPHLNLSFPQQVQVGPLLRPQNCLRPPDRATELKEIAQLSETQMLHHLLHLKHLHQNF